jgi:hypothetical protein
MRMAECDDAPSAGKWAMAVESGQGKARQQQGAAQVTGGNGGGEQVTMA